MKIGNLYKITNIHADEIQFNNPAELKKYAGTLNTKSPEEFFVKNKTICMYMGEDFYKDYSSVNDPWHVYLFFWDNKIVALLQEFYKFEEIICD